jgi:hypothetical protein
MDVRGSWDDLRRADFSAGDRLQDGVASDYLPEQPGSKLPFEPG